MKKLRIMLIIFAVGLLATTAIGQSLTLSDTPSMMYWTDSSIKKIQRANLDGSGVRDLIAVGLGRPHGMALDPSSGKMYWTDLNFDSIQRANLDGSHIETLVATGSIAPIGITLDVEAGKMYWTDSVSHKIQRANLNGSGIEDLVTTGLQWPQGIALDVTGGKMYWTDGGTVKIQRSNLDGSGVEDLYSMSFGSGAPIGIALDACGGKMYWTDVVNHRIQRANMNGSNVEILVTTGGNLRGIALDAAAGKMYWTDTLFDKIQRANLNGTGIEDLVTTGLDYPIGLALDVLKPPKIIYVDADASGANSGSSWADAYNSLLSALGAAESGGEIRVAEGIYKPTGYVTPPPSPMGGSNTDEIVATAEDRSATFYLVNGVAIQGGYAGFGEQDPDVRDPNTYETILSGDIGIEGNNSDNCYHVLCCVLVDVTAVLDGVTITGGNANEEYPSQHSCGGGMYNIFSSPTLNNCTFSRNSASRDGGGMFNSEQSNPTLTNCTFTGNSTIYDGGAMCNRTSSPTITNCTFTGNSANHGAGISNWPGSPILTACTFIGNSAELGGAVFNWDSSPILANCIFGNNSAREWGGAICNLSNSSPMLVSCTFNGNRAGDRGNGMNNRINSYPMVTNCIFWDGGDEIYNTDGSTTMITYSDVQGGWPGEGNIMADPRFVQPGYRDTNGVWIDGDYHLLQTSACINAGDNNSLPADTQDLDGDGNTVEPIPFDIEGNPRIVYDVVDMGAFEFENTPPIADAGPDQIIECACNTEKGTKVTLDGTNSSDPDYGVLTYTWTGPFLGSPVEGAASTVTLEDGCPGDYVITLVVDDGIDESEPNEVVIRVVDTTPPEFELSVSPAMLWPPDHKMVEITPSWTVSDECDPSPDVSLISIVANEGDNIIGDGHTSNDIQIDDDGSIFVRSERSGTDTGRIYTITYQAVDDCGNVTVCSATVSIPHDFKVLARIASRWLWSGPAGRIPEDLNADGVVNLADFAKFAGNWTR